MQCTIHPRIPYLDVPGLVRQQREVIQKRIQLHSNSHIIYTGLDCFGDTGGNIAIENIRGIKKSMIDPTTSRSDSEILFKFLTDLLQQIKVHPNAWPFLKPVDPIELNVPDYFNVIKDPIDLETIEKRLNTRVYYITKEIFYSDLKRMCDNCRTYNAKDSQYYDYADKLEAFFVAKLV